MEQLNFFSIIKKIFFTPVKNTIFINYNNAIDRVDFFLSLVLEVIYAVLILKLLDKTSIYSEYIWFIVNSLISIFFYLSLFSLIIRRHKTLHRNLKFTYILFILTLLHSLCATYFWSFLVGYSPFPRNFTLLEQIINVYYYVSIPFVFVGILVSIVRSI